MFGLSKALKMAAIAGEGASPIQLAWRNSCITYGSGHNGIAQSNGTTELESNTRQPLINRTGAPITSLKVGYQGFRADAFVGVVDGNNDVPINVGVEYPAGTVNQALFGGASLGTIPLAGHLISDEVVLSTPIPAGATYFIRSHALVAAGERMNRRAPNASPNLFSGITSELGTGFGDKSMSGTISGTAQGILCNAVLTYTDAVTPYFTGDSLFTNNASPGALACRDLNMSACVQSIIGTTAQQQAASGKMTQRIAWAQAIGITHWFFNWGSNDIAGVRSRANLKADVNSIIGQIQAAGIRAVYGTLLPRSSVARSVSSLTSVGTTATGALASTTGLTSGYPYLMAGASPSAYNGRYAMTVTGPTGFSYLFAGGTSPATGSITFSTEWYDLSSQIQTIANFTGGVNGNASEWAAFNDDVRARVITADYYFDGADAVTPSRNDCRWGSGTAWSASKGQDKVVVTAIGSPTTTSIPVSQTFPHNAYLLGAAITGLTGVNAGLIRLVSTNTGSTIATNAWPSAPSPGDTFLVEPVASRGTNDGVHTLLLESSTSPIQHYGSDAAYRESIKAVLQSL